MLEQNRACPIIPSFWIPGGESPFEEDITILDYDFYNPTLHTLLDEVVLGDINVFGWSINCDMANKMINDNRS